MEASRSAAKAHYNASHLTLTPPKEAVKTSKDPRMGPCGYTTLQIFSILVPPGAPIGSPQVMA